MPERNNRRRLDTVRVFSASSAAQREQLGERITGWLRQQERRITGKEVHQTATHAYHCLTVVVFYRDAGEADETATPRAALGPGPPPSGG